MPLFRCSHCGHLLCVTTFVLLFVDSAYAQDSHFNTHQYGSRSALMGGSVVGGVRDSSASYYNPAGLAFIDNPNLSVSANAYTIGESNLGNFAGTDTDLKSTMIGIVPLLMSGVILNEEKLPGHVFGFCVLSRQQFDFSGDQRVSYMADIINRPDFPGEEHYVASAHIHENVQEAWAGLSWGYAVHEQFAIGVTLFGALREHSATGTARARAISSQPGFLGLPPQASTDYGLTYSFWNIRFFAKLGMQLDLDDVRLGIALTTPSISIIGRGTVAGDYTVNNQQVLLDPSGDFTFNARDDGVKSRYWTPVMLSFGAEVHAIERAVFGISLDFSPAASTYSIMKPEPHPLYVGPFAETLPGTLHDVRPRYGYRAVLNVNFGVEYQIVDDIRGMFSFRTDFSAAPNDDNIYRMQYTTSNIFHLTLGAMIRMRGDDEWNEGQLINEVSIGLQFSFGSRTTRQFVNLSEPADGEPNYLLGWDQLGETRMSYWNLGILIGYTHYI